jgi:predicted transcriptional regulator
MNDRTEKVMQSTLYKSGDEFKLSDMCGRIQLSARNTKAILDDMVKENLLIVDASGKNPSYQRTDNSKTFVSKPWVNYVPPKPANQKFSNPWVTM